ncbi:hypothetical protein GJ633_08185 [Halorubrum sp. CBA1125]|uniref:hypothetical protein n=1 Tax=Halorubrum sp. CBA1125 TaxID=2668072 RepID=UPI0012E87A15|nr:hypothetical protein [Halorubrum sp. CBA1125]MUW14648.1 hypothetical protein [Halorubrum sp. CBA1125]
MSYSHSSDDVDVSRQELTTIDRPDMETIRGLAGTARSISPDDDRVSVNFGGLIPESQALTFKHQLLFNVQPCHRAVDGDDAVFSAVEPVEIKGVDLAFVCVRVRGDRETHRVSDVELSAEII